MLFPEDDVTALNRLEKLRPHVGSAYTVTPQECWEWQGYIDRNGYGKAYDPSAERGSRLDWAHRVSYRFHRGPIPDGLELDHECQNPPCINPDHLAAVTRSEHVRRTMQRLGKDDLHLAAARLRKTGLTYAEIADALRFSGRESAFGAVNAAIAKGLISPSDVPRRRNLTRGERDDIRALYAVGIPQTELGAWYEVDSSQVSRICSGLTSGRGGRESS